MPRVKCTRLGLRGTMSKRGGRREGSGRKKLDVCKSKRIRISEDLFQRWKDLKRIRKARSDEELLAYLLDLATATDLSDSPMYGKRRTTVTSLSFINLHSFRHHVAFSTKFCKQTPRGRTFFTHAYFTTQITFQTGTLWLHYWV